MIQRPETEDKIGGKVQLDHYQGHSLELDDWKLDKGLDDILMCQYADINDDGTEVKRGSICMCCGRTLTDEFSMLTKLGKTCA
jgi:hypothetical protein